MEPQKKTLPCTGCREEKAVTEFHANKSVKRGYHHQCRSCRSIYRKARWRDPARYEYNLAHARAGSRKRWLSRYGLTPEQYDALLKRQNGRCFICGGLPPKKRKGRSVLDVDHDHLTGQVRSLLCNPCNLGLGAFKDNPTLLLRAAQYLRGFGIQGSLS